MVVGRTGVNRDVVSSSLTGKQPSSRQSGVKGKERLSAVPFLLRRQLRFSKNFFGSPVIQGDAPKKRPERVRRLFETNPSL